jgi:hypothetical protein
MKLKSHKELEESIRFYRAIIVLMIVLIVLAVVAYERKLSMKDKQLYAQVLAHEELTVKYDSLNYDVVTGSCLLRSQL